MTQKEKNDIILVRIGENVELVKAMLRDLKREVAASNRREEPNQLLTVSQLAAAFNVSRGTVYNWKTAGYVFQFGRRTTAEHCRNWLASRSEPTAAEIAAVDEKLQQLERRQRNKRRNS